MFPKIGPFVVMLQNILYSFGSFLLFYVIFHTGFTFAFHLAFGPYLKNYATLPVTAMTLFRMLLTDFDYQELENTNLFVGGCGLCGDCGGCVTVFVFSR